MVTFCLSDEVLFEVRVPIHRSGARRYAFYTLIGSIENMAGTRTVGSGVVFGGSNVCTDAATVVGTNQPAYEPADALDYCSQRSVVVVVVCSGVDGIPANLRRIAIVGNQ
jgi:hypothetical protein